MTINGARERLSIEVDLISPEASNRPGRRLIPTHVTLHNTDNSSPGADARAHGRYVKGADARARKVSWHYSVDDVRVVQHVPDVEVAWHAGSGNSRSIAIEICHHVGIDQAAANDRAALLTAVLMKTHNIAAEAVVPHQHWTGKNCPRLLLAGSGGFEAFRAGAAAYAASIDAEMFTPSPARSAEAGAMAEISTGQEGNWERRVRVLERLLGRAMADLELLREDLDEINQNSYEGP